MPPKYRKFILQELPQIAVVNVHDNLVVDNTKEELINAVVTEHLSTIINGESEESHVDTEVKDEVFDLDQIKIQQYNKGLDDAKKQYELLLDELQSNKAFGDLLSQKLSEITPVSTLDLELTRVTAQLIEGIAKKIYLILPVDFERILRSALLEKIRNFYKKGKIKLTVNPLRYDLCLNVLEIENLPAQLKDNLEIVINESYGVNDCKLECDNTSLEYSQSQLSEEIDKILEQLRSKSE